MNIRELICIHQFYPFYSDNGKYGGHYCLHCGKWKTLPNQVDFYVDVPKQKYPFRFTNKDFFEAARSMRDLAEAFRALGNAFSKR